MPRIYQALANAVEQKEPFALGIISGIKGSSPQKKGAKAIFFADGRIAGTLGGGCLEAEIRDRARRSILDGNAATFDLLLDHDFGWDDGLICGGRVFGLILPQAAQASQIWSCLVRPGRTLRWGVKRDFQIAWADNSAPADWLYQETVFPPCQLWIAGSGHIAQAVAPFALAVDFEVTVFDDRPALANPRFFPEKTKLRVDYWERLLEEPFPDQPAFGLIATRGHQHDARVLKHWVAQPFAFLGMIGSRRKARIIFAQFIEEKIASAAQLQRVFCPVGLDIHAQTPAEIALSVAAQLVEKRAEIVYEKNRIASVDGEPGCLARAKPGRE